MASIVFGYRLDLNDRHDGVKGRQSVSESHILTWASYSEDNRKCLLKGACLAFLIFSLLFVLFLIVPFFPFSRFIWPSAFQMYVKYCIVKYFLACSVKNNLASFNVVKELFTKGDLFTERNNSIYRDQVLRCEKIKRKEIGIQTFCWHLKWEITNITKRSQNSHYVRLTFVDAHYKYQYR